MGFEVEGSTFKAERINLRVLFTDYKGNQRKEALHTHEANSKDGKDDKNDLSAMSEGRMI